MEFEKNKPATAEDIALANIPKMTLQPVHAELSQSESTINTFTHQNEATFSFESESTDTSNAALRVDTIDNPHHRTALVTSLLVIAAFSSSLLVLFLLK